MFMQKYFTWCLVCLIGVSLTAQVESQETPCETLGGCIDVTNHPKELGLPPKGSCPIESAETTQGDICTAAKIQLTSITPLSGTVSGPASELAQDYKLIAYVKTDIWYIHAFEIQLDRKRQNHSDLKYVSPDKVKFFIKTVKRTFPAEEVMLAVVKKSFAAPAQVRDINSITGAACAHAFYKGNGNI